MSQTLPTLNLANDIAFAVFRVAALINLSYLRIELENAAIEFLSSLSDNSISKLERLIKLGQNIKQISEINSQVLIRELGHIRQYLNAATLADNPTKQDIDLSKEFSLIKKPSQRTRPNNLANAATNPANAANNAANNSATNAAANSANKNGRVNGQLDQLIAQYLNQNPEFRFKDFCSDFPSISNRTLRRIINRQLKLGQLIRVGNPGPASFYRVVSGLKQAPVLEKQAPAPEKQPPAPESGLYPSHQISQPPSIPPELLKVPETSPSQAPELSTPSNPPPVIAL